MAAVGHGHKKAGQVARQVYIIGCRPNRAGHRPSAGPPAENSQADEQR